MIELGAMLGAIMSGYTAEKFSRKYAILMYVILHI
jgi:MFS-type transporter involved in bile tolerance (Atg22 family)